MRRLLVAALLFPAIAAADVTASWTNATCATDGSALPPWDSGLPNRLVSTRLEYGLCAADGSFTDYRGEVTVPMPASSAAIATVVTDQFCLRVDHADAEGDRSIFNGPVRLGDPATPLGPVCVWVPPPDPAPTPEPTPEPEPAPEPVPAGPLVVPNVSGANVSVAWGITGTGKRSSTSKAHVPVGTACLGPVLFTYRGQSYRRYDQSVGGWHGRDSVGDDAAVACL